MTESNFGKSFRKDFLLEPEYLPINHGSYGTYPNCIRPLLREYQDNAEKHPDRWNRFEGHKLIKNNLERLSKNLNCDPKNLAFAQNASTGINNVLRSFPFKEGDKILMYQTSYASVNKTLNFLSDHYKVELISIQLDYPIEDDEVVQLTKKVIEREHANSTSMIRMAVFDAITSVPGVRFPFEKINRLVQDHGILSLIDAAHAIGQIELNLTELDPDFLVSNCHKWSFTPRGCAILYVPARNQGFIHPTSITAAYEFHTDGTDSSSFSREFAPSTMDMSPFMCVEAALNYRESIGGEEAIRAYTHDLAVQGGDLVAKIFGTQVMENSTKTLTASMVNIELPAFTTTKSDIEIMNFFLNKSIYDYNTTLSVYKNNSKWWVRLSGQIYLDLDDFEKAAKIILAIIKEL